MTLKEYLAQLGWTATDLSRYANINVRTARKAVVGETVSNKVAQAIARAISDAMGKLIHVGDIEGLKLAERAQNGSGNPTEDD